MPATPERIGLIAGNGRFPLLFAEAARRAGIESSRGTPERDTGRDRQTW